MSLADEDMGLKHLAADYRKRASLNARGKARGQSSRRSAAPWARHRGVVYIEIRHAGATLREGMGDHKSWAKL